MALSFTALRQLAADNLTPSGPDDRIYSAEHRGFEYAVIDKMEELAQTSESGLYIIGRVKKFSETNLTNLATAAALPGIVAGDAVGIVNQTNTVENGPYIYTGTGYRRATTSDGFNPIISGGILTSGPAAYVLRTRGTVVVGTTPQQWDPFSVNTGYDEYLEVYLPVTSSGQTELQLDPSLSTIGEIRSVSYVQPDFDRRMRKSVEWSFDASVSKFFFTPTAATRIYNGHYIRVDIVSHGSGGAYSGILFFSQGPDIYYRFGFETDNDLKLMGELPSGGSGAQQLRFEKREAATVAAAKSLANGDIPLLITIQNGGSQKMMGYYDPAETDKLYVAPLMLAP